MKNQQKRQTMNSHKACLAAVTIMAVSTATIVDALVPRKSTIAIKNSQCPSYIDQEGRRNPKRSSRLEVLAAPIENGTDLLSSLPAMSAEIKQENTNSNYQKQRKKRRSKQGIKNNTTNSLKVNGVKRNYGKTNGSSDQCTSSENLLDTIPNLSDILEGTTSFNVGIEEETENKNTKEILSDILEGATSLNIGTEEETENKNTKKIKVIKTKPNKNIEVAAPTRIIKNDVPATRSTDRIEISDKNINSLKKEEHSNAEKNKQRTKSTAAVRSKAKVQDAAVQTTMDWRANYKASKRTNGRLQKAFFESTSLVQGTFSHAKLILDTLLDTPPQYCNAVNLVCALTYSAKAMGHKKVDHLEKNVGYRTSLQETFDILHDLLVVHRDEGLFTPRQLCNVVWAIAKHVDRDPSLMVSTKFNSPESRLEETIDEIARQLTTILREDDESMNETADTAIAQSKPAKSSFQQPKIKLGEICMACWAYGKLRHREIPPGWPAPPQMGAVENPNSILSGWKTQQLGRRRRFLNSFDSDENDEDDYSMQELSETDILFDAIGYAMCKSEFGDEQEEDTKDVSHTGMLQDCTWSELANVGWAFASHGRCRSPESEALLKAVALEASNRLKNGVVANNSNYQTFLVRDVTQLLWSLGTLQTDNFRLADDLIVLVESLTANLKLGTSSRSRFAQGRPLRSWSCADLVQTSVALAHARIDETLLLRAVYEEGNHRLMEGASSTRKEQSSLAPFQTKSNNLPRGENRRTFHPWEASILLWSQARLFLTEQEGVEFDEFAEDAPLFFLKALRESRGSFSKAKIGPQEQANIVWSLVILEKFHSTEAIILIDLIFAEAARSCKENKKMQLEHAHQLWQAYFMLEEDCPEAVKRVPRWFVSYLKDKWNVEKARLKMSSARHQSLSSTLQLMGVDHINEHDEDIDVAIILKPNAIWVHETDMEEMDNYNDEEDFYESDFYESDFYESTTDGEDQVSVAVEFDGPNHFTRITGDAPMEPPRALGHTVLKYRLLKKQGWTVVRVPYYEFDKIPFWASMERQRYLQRKLKTHANIQFSDVDVSEYKALTPNRVSRYD